MLQLFLRLSALPWRPVGFFKRKVSCILTSVLDGREWSYRSWERSRRHVLERIPDECRSQTERGDGEKNPKDQTRSSNLSLHRPIISFLWIPQTFEYECTGSSSLRMCVQLMQQRDACPSARLMEFLRIALSARSRQMLRGAPDPVRGFMFWGIIFHALGVWVGQFRMTAGIMSHSLRGEVLNNASTVQFSGSTNCNNRKEESLRNNQR
jgi:hypothetical protein